ncbi:MAG: 2-oxo acid dehydrogenase subunit E2 [Anaerolineae bacterium]|nr:2-oxo acid dehydrogenase subunit E2 [Anaerolineae bacterium]
MLEITLPKLTHDMQTGAFVQWYKREGDAVKRGDALYAVETDKATVDVEAEAGGVLTGVLARPGDEIAIGQVLAYLAAPGETIETTGRVPGPGAGGRVVATPLARRVAREAGVDLRQVRGSGPHGRIVRADVLRVRRVQTTPAVGAADAPGADSDYEVVARSRVQAQTAARLTRMWQESPLYILDLDADMTEAIRWREKTGRARSFTTLLVKVAAAALENVPQVNSLWIDGELRRHRAVNVGVAIATPSGVIVPVIHDANQLTAQQIQARLAELRERAGAGRLMPSDLGGGTFTVTNLGMYGVDAFAAVINPPQVAILACGRIVETPVARHREVVIRPLLRLRLTVDHRALDGAEAAPFLVAVKDLLENPYRLI